MSAKLFGDERVTHASGNLMEKHDLGYSTQQVVGLTRLTENQIRTMVRRSFVSPTRSRRGWFSFPFQDVVLLRTVGNLLNAGSLDMRKTVSILSNLKGKLGPGKSLISFVLTAANADIFVKDGERLWEAATGQGQLDFQGLKIKTTGHTDKKNKLGQVIGFPKSNPNEFTSDDWYNLGFELEEVDRGRAVRAYVEAIKLDASNIDAHINLGRLFQLDGDLKRAKHLYSKALRIDPDHQIAIYNMGTIYDELNETDNAVLYYQRAHVVARAHYNLGRIFEMRGEELKSKQYYKRYRQLVKEKE